MDQAQQDACSRTPLSTITNTCVPASSADPITLTPKSSKRICTYRPSSLKKLAVDMVMSGQRKAAVCRELGIPESTLRGWIKIVEPNSSSRSSPAPSSLGSGGYENCSTDDEADQPLDLSHAFRCEGSRIGSDEEPRSIDEAIEHADKFYRWVEQGNEPGVTGMQILQLAALVGELKRHRDCEQRHHFDDGPVDYSKCGGC